MIICKKGNTKIRCFILKLYFVIVTTVKQFSYFTKYISEKSSNNDNSNLFDVIRIQ